MWPQPQVALAIPDVTGQPQDEDRPGSGRLDRCAVARPCRHTSGDVFPDTTEGIERRSDGDD